MPRPPILTPIDWKSIFAGARPYEQWLVGAEFEENAARIRERYAGFEIPGDILKGVMLIERSVFIVAFAEDWCGDVVRHVPPIQSLVDSSDRLNIGYLWREDQPEIFARFVTNGGEAIPKFVFLSEDFVECGNWGPMPAAERELIARGKACGEVPAARQKVTELYNGDPKCRKVFDEVLYLIQIASCTAP